MKKDRVFFQKGRFDKLFMNSRITTAAMTMKEKILGDLEVLGNPHMEDSSGASFHSQISAIFPHPEKEGLYIALADRWIPGLQLTEKKTEKLMRDGILYGQTVSFHTAG